MKTYTLSALAMLVTVAVLSSGCGQLGPGTSQNPIEQLISLCKEDNYKEVAKHMRYPGMDANKKNDTANYESGDANEKRQIERTCSRAKALAAAKHTISAERMEQGFYVYDVEVEINGKMDKQLWAFKKNGDTYVLVDID